MGVITALRRTGTVWESAERWQETNLQTTFPPFSLFHWTHLVLSGKNDTRYWRQDMMHRSPGKSHREDKRFRYDALIADNGVLGAAPP